MGELEILNYYQLAFIPMQFIAGFTGLFSLLLGLSDFKGK